MISIYLLHRAFWRCFLAVGGCCCSTNFCVHNFLLWMAKSSWIQYEGEFSGSRNPLKIYKNNIFCRNIWCSQWLFYRPIQDQIIIFPCSGRIGWFGHFYFKRLWTWMYLEPLLQGLWQQCGPFLLLCSLLFTRPTWPPLW